MNFIKRSWMTFVSFVVAVVVIAIGCTTMFKGKSSVAGMPSSQRGNYAVDYNHQSVPWVPQATLANYVPEEKTIPRRPSAVKESSPEVIAEVQAFEKKRQAFSKAMDVAYEKQTTVKLKEAVKNSRYAKSYRDANGKTHSVDVEGLEANRLTPVAVTMEHDYFQRYDDNKKYDNNIGMNKKFAAWSATAGSGAASPFTGVREAFHSAKSAELKMKGTHPLAVMEKFSNQANPNSQVFPGGNSKMTGKSTKQEDVQPEVEKPPMAAAVPKSYYSYDDFYDPNDYLSSAYSLVGYEDRWLSGISGVGKQYDDDWFKIYVSSSYKRLILDLRFTHSYGDIDMKLYDSYGYQVASSTSSSNDEYIDITLSSGGYYYVKIYYSNSGNTYDFKWKTMYTGGGDDYYEPNDYASSYYDLSSYDNYWLNSVHGIGVAGDDDWYRVYIPSGRQRLIVDLRYSHYSGGDIDMEVWNSTATSRIGSSTSANDDEYLDLSGLSPGYYLIRVYPYSSYPSNPNVYDMKWYSVQTGPVWYEDTHEPDDSRYDANSRPELGNGQTVSGNQFDDDWYRFYVPSSAKRVKLDLNFNSSYGDLDLQLVDDAGHVWGSSRGASSREFIDVTLPEGGRYYYARVFYGNTGSSYTLKLDLLSTFTDDVYEPNDSYGQATDLTNRQNIWLSNHQGLAVSHDVDYYKIQVQQGYKNLIVDLRYVHSQGNISVQVRDGSGNVYASSDNQRDDEYIDTVLTNPGTYYIVVAGAYNNNQYDMRWFTREDQSAFKDGHSGMWFNPVTNGQGNNITFLRRPNGQHEAWMSWYTYDPTATTPTARPMWFVAMGPVTNDVANLSVYTTNGGEFTTRPQEVVNNFVGTAALTMIDCANARLAFNFSTYPGVQQSSGVIPFVLLTPTLVQGGKNICNGITSNSPATTTGIQRGHTGLWYNKDTSGQGFDFNFVNTTEGTVRAIATWYTYKPGESHPARKHWFYMDGAAFNPGSEKVSMTIYSPTDSGKFNQNPPAPNVPVWGKGQFHFTNCGYNTVPGTGEPAPAGTFKFSQNMNVNFDSPSMSGNDYTTIPLYRLSPVGAYNGQPLCNNW